MKQPPPIPSVSAPLPIRSLDTATLELDTATLELLAAWKAEDATTDPPEIREAAKEIAEFKKAMNQNRASTGARLLFP